MSLHKFADMVAKQGRGDDSLLIHMTPDEVQRLQSFAEANGRSLTINPETGLPEAGMLSDLFKAVAPIALGAFLGPGAFGIAGLGLSATTAGLVTGGLTTLATGSLSRGLMAGLGAYGGAGLAEGFMGAGAGAAQQSAMGALTQEQIATQMAESGLTQQGVLNQAAADATKSALANTGQAVSAGFNAATATPTAALDFAKQNWKPIAAAALPVLGAIQTTTPAQAAKPTDTGYIRQKIVNQDGTVTDLTPVKASEWGDKNFSDVYRGYNGGGIVALAGGGDVVRMAGGTPPAMLTDEQLYQKTGSWEAAAAARDQQNRALNIFNDAQRLSAATYVPPAGGLSNVKVNTQAEVDAANAANPYSAQNMAKVDVTRPGQYVNDASGNPVALSAGVAGFNANNPTALTYLGELASKGGQDSTSQAFNQIATAAQKAEADRLWAAEKARLEAIDAANAAKAPTGLAGLNQNQNLLTNQNQNLLTNQNQNLLTNQNQNAGLAALANLPADASYTTKWYAERGLGFDPIDQVIEGFLAKYKPQLDAMLPKDQEAAMRAALDKEKLNEADVIKATGMTIAQLVQAKRADGSIIVPGKLEEVPVGSLPGGVSGAGITDINANGTITTRPDITGLTTSETRKMYTDGGGSLGYTSPAPKTIAEFEQMYNKQTGDSLAAYNYLMGKGAYPTKSSVGQIEKPYKESVLGYPTSTNKMYNWDAATGRMVRNPDYVAPGRDAKGNVTYGMSLNDVKAALAKTPMTGQTLYEWAQTNNLSAQDIADATGRTLSSVYADFRAGSKAAAETKEKSAETAAATGKYDLTNQSVQPPEDNNGPWSWDVNTKKWVQYGKYAAGGMAYAVGGGIGSLGSYSDGGRLLKGPGDGVSDSIPATIGAKQQPARLADGEFVIPARIVSELGNGSTDAGAKKLYAMMDRVQRARGKTTGKNKVAANSRADKYLPA